MDYADDLADELRWAPSMRAHAPPTVLPYDVPFTMAARDVTPLAGFVPPVRYHGQRYVTVDDLATLPPLVLTGEQQAALDAALARASREADAAIHRRWLGAWLPALAPR